MMKFCEICAIVTFVCLMIQLCEAAIDYTYTLFLLYDSLYIRHFRNSYMDFRKNDPQEIKAGYSAT